MAPRCSAASTRSVTLPVWKMAQACRLPVRSSICCSPKRLVEGGPWRPLSHTRRARRDRSRSYELREVVNESGHLRISGTIACAYRTKTPGVVVERTSRSFGDDQRRVGLVDGRLPGAPGRSCRNAGFEPNGSGGVGAYGTPPWRHFRV